MFLRAAGHRSIAIDRSRRPRMMTRMTPAQARAARALLDLSQDDLARSAGVEPSVIADFEDGHERPSAETLARIAAALAKAGAVLMAAGEQADGGPGVRLRTWPGALPRGAEPDEIAAMEIEALRNTDA